MPSSPGTNPGFTRSVRLWTWAAILLSIALGLVITWLHYSQAETVRRARQMLTDFREARIDLAKGFLHVTLSGDPASPFRQEVGLALLRQASTALQEAELLADAGDPSPRAADLLATFRARVVGFLNLLTTYRRGRAVGDHEQELPLYLALHELEELAQRVEAHTRDGLQTLTARQNQRFATTLVAAMTLMAAMCTGVYQAGRRQSEAVRAMRESEARLRTLGDSIPGGALYQLLMPPDGRNRYTYVSAGFERIFGLPADRILADPAAFWRLVAEEDRERLAAEERRCAGLLAVFDLEFRQHTVTGEVRWIHARSTPRRLPDGSILWDGVATDITERKAQEAEIRRLTRLHVTLSQINQAIARVQSREELFQKVCEVTARHGGFRLVWVGWRDPGSQQVIPVARAGDDSGYLDEVRVYADSRPEGCGPIGTCIRTGRPSIHNDFQIAIETLPWHEAALRHGLQAVAAFPLRFRGEVWGAFTVYDDATGTFQDKEVTLLEEAAMDIDYAVEHLESEVRFRTLFEQAAVGVAEIETATGRFLRVNQRYSDLLGCTAEDMLRLDFRTITHPADLAEELAHMEQLEAGTLREFSLEKRYHRRDGQLVWVALSASLLDRADAGPARHVTVVQDITARKEAELRLRNEESALRGILNATTESVFLFSPEGKILTANETAARRYGRSVAEIVDRNFRELMSPELVQSRNLCLQEALRSVSPVEFEDERAGIEFRHCLYPIVEADGEVHAVVCYSRDITARKRAERALEEHAARLASVVQAQRELAAANVGYDALLQLILDCLSRLTGAEGASLELAEGDELVYQAASGLSSSFVGLRLKIAGSLSGLCMSSDAVLRSDDTENDPRVDREACRRIGLRSMCLLPLRYGEHSLGVLKVMSAHVAAFSGSAEQTLRLMGEFLSATICRKQAEEALRRSEARYRTLVDHLPIGLFLADTTGHILMANPAALRLSRLPADEDAVGRHVLDFQVPEERENARRLFEGALQAGGFPPFDGTVLCADGTRVSAEFSGAVVNDDGGRPVAFMAMAQDITERRRAGEALRRSEEQLRLKLDSMLSPDVELGEDELVNLLDIPALQTLMDNFSRLSHAVVAILDTRGRILLSSGWQDVCTRFHRVHPESACHCTESDLALAGSLRPGQHVAYHCRNGLWDVVTPLIVGGKHVGNIFTGQFFYDDDVIDETSFEAQAARYGFDRESYLAALRRVPRVSREWVETLMVFLTQFSELISRSSFTNLKLARALVQQKRIEEERIAMEAHLRQQQKLESIGTLASGVAHEINNPITGILNYAQLIQDRLPAGSPLTEFTGEIMLETKRVATIVRNLLTFARNERQSHSPARIADVIDAVLSLVRTVIRRDQITLIVNVPEDLPQLKCRSQQIQQVVMNLVTNARDALNDRYPGHHPDKVLGIGAQLLDRAGHPWIRLTVEDHGTGILPEVRERMFDPFYTTKGRDRGTGLGLSISHGIVKEHHGEWVVESEPGRCTRMHVDLPADNGWET